MGNDSQFKQFCEVVACPSLAGDLRFASNQARVENRPILCQKISDILIKNSSAYWLTLFERKGIPCGPINNIKQAFDEPQAKHRSAVSMLSHPYNDELPTVANPVKFSRTPICHGIAPPLLGADVDCVLGSVLGYSKEKISILRKQKVI